MIQSANLGLRFILELGVLAVLGYWGYRTGGSTVTKLALAGGAVAATAVVWATFVSPNASVEVPAAVHLLLQVLVFATAAAALVSLHRPTLASVFGATVLVNAALMAAWNQ